MSVSGNSVAGKSFMSFTVNDGLLQKVVEAVKSGEKDARTSGEVKSFEVFYKGFRQNISIGRIFIVPAKVCDSRNNFPIALLYGTAIRELNLGEEVADLITHKMGDSEFDEYSQADYKTIKDTFFTGEDGKLTSLIIFAPNWSGIREYVGFKFTSDDDQLTNLLRHLVFSSYYSPNVSSAFNAMMTTVDTNKLDVTDITPKLTYPFLSENPLRAFPELTKQGSWTKGRIFLTAKTADAITQEILDPQELNVFEALDSALTESTLPSTESMDEVADYKGPNGNNTGNAEIPEIEAIKESISNTQEMNVENEKKASSNPNRHRMSDLLDAMGITIAEYMSRTEAQKEQLLQTAADKLEGKIATKPKKAEAPFETPFTNVGPGTTAHENEDSAIAVDTTSKEGEKPIGIVLDETGLPLRPEEERKTVADKVASEITRDLDDGYVAMSSRTKSVNQKNEDHLNKYATRSKMADVSLTIDSIWNEITEDFGEAPQVELPSGGGSSKSVESKPIPESKTKSKPKDEDLSASKPAPKKETLDKEEPKKEGVKSKLLNKDKEASKTKVTIRVAGKQKTMEFSNKATADAFVKGASAKFGEKFEIIAGVEGDISEAKAEVVSPCTVDSDIKQPTKSGEEAAKVSSIKTAENEVLTPSKHLATDINKNLTEAVSELDANAKYELADNSEATKTVNSEHFAAISSSPLIYHCVIRDEDGTVEEATSVSTVQLAASWFDEHGISLDAVSSKDHDDYSTFTYTKGKNPSVIASAGDENNEEIEMALSFGDLADLGANLPHQDEHKTAKWEEDYNSDNVDTPQVDRYGINRPDTGHCSEHGCFYGETCDKCDRKAKQPKL
jgi:hypothetical protein